MQGQLRGEHLSVEVETACKHCNMGMRFTIDSQLQVSIQTAGADPRVFMPDVDWGHFAERTIIDAY